VPPQVNAAIAKALEKLPADRWQTTSEFVSTLTGAESRVGAGPGRWRWMSAAIPWAIAASLALALGWVAARQSLRSTPPQGPVRFGVEFDKGVQPSFTPIVRLSADGRQLFVSAMVERREEVLRHALDRLGMQVIKGAGQGEQGTGNSRPFVSPDG